MKALPFDSILYLKHLDSSIFGFLRHIQGYDCTVDLEWVLGLFVGSSLFSLSLGRNHHVNDLLGSSVYYLLPFAGAKGDRFTKYMVQSLWSVRFGAL